MIVIIRRTETYTAKIEVDSLDEAQRLINEGDDSLHSTLDDNYDECHTEIVASFD